MTINISTTDNSTNFSVESNPISFTLSQVGAPGPAGLGVGEAFAAAELIYTEELNMVSTNLLHRSANRLAAGLDWIYVEDNGHEVFFGRVDMLNTAYGISDADLAGHYSDLIYEAPATPTTIYLAIHNRRNLYYAKSRNIGNRTISVYSIKGAGVGADAGGQLTGQQIIALINDADADQRITANRIDGSCVVDANINPDGAESTVTAPSRRAAKHYTDSVALATRNSINEDYIRPLQAEDANIIGRIDAKISNEEVGSVNPNENLNNSTGFSRRSVNHITALLEGRLFALEAGGGQGAPIANTQSERVVHLFNNTDLTDIPNSIAFDGGNISDGGNWSTLPTTPMRSASVIFTSADGLVWVAGPPIYVNNALVRYAVSPDDPNSFTTSPDPQVRYYYFSIYNEDLGRYTDWIATGIRKIDEVGSIDFASGYRLQRDHILLPRAVDLHNINRLILNVTYAGNGDYIYKHTAIRENFAFHELLSFDDSATAFDEQPHMACLFSDRDDIIVSASTRPSNIWPDIINEADLHVLSFSCNFNKSLEATADGLADRFSIWSRTNSLQQNVSLTVYLERR